MPPKPKLDEETIVQAAFEIVRDKGAQALTARSLAEALETSPRPLFTVFDSMSNIQDAVYKKARATFREFMEESAKYEPTVLAFGVRWVAFAKLYPHLFEIVVMKKKYTADSFTNIIADFSDAMSLILEELQVHFNIPEESARTAFMETLTHANGLAMLQVLGANDFSFEEINKLISQIGAGMMFRMQVENGTFDLEFAKSVVRSYQEMPWPKEQ